MYVFLLGSIPRTRWRVEGLMKTIYDVLSKVFAPADTGSYFRISMRVSPGAAIGEFELKGWSLRICPLDPLFLAPHLGELGKHGATCFLSLPTSLPLT